MHSYVLIPKGKKLPLRVIRQYIGGVKDREPKVILVYGGMDKVAVQLAQLGLSEIHNYYFRRATEKELWNGVNIQTVRKYELI